MTNDFKISDIKSFNVNVNKLKITSDSPIRFSKPHIHDLCEIYVNVTGNVSFVVENNLYNILPGDIIITKPYEYHHCIYNDDSEHSHYWIMFSPHENPDLFDFILEKKRGKNNLIRLYNSERDEIFKLCERIATLELSPYATISCFFEIISLIYNCYKSNDNLIANNNIPSRINEIFDYVNKNHIEIKSISEITEKFGISPSTLERYFKKYLSITPIKYIEQLKLATACKLLRQNYSVTYACFESGFDDSSHFIAKFKNEFKTTPLKYKKHILNN